MNKPPTASWRKSRAPEKRRKLNDSAVSKNPEFQNETLPIHSRRLDIMSTLASTQVLIVQGDTGCGKTTQIPKFIVNDYPQSRIVVTQPRRLAAVGVARRVARELGSSLGDKVGYHIRGEKNYNESSQIVFMTTGMFIQELVGRNKLEWSHIILDEVHERAIETEFLLVVLKHMLYNSDTKLILMSATINARLFANYFAESELQKLSSKNTAPSYNYFCNFNPNQAQINNFETDREDAAPIRLAGPKNFAVKEIYLEEILDLLADDLNFSQTELEEINGYFRGELVNIDSHFFKIAAFLVRSQHLMRIYEETKPQTFLIFLPGIHEITKMGRVLNDDVMRDHSEELEICQLHSSIPEDSHGSIFKDPEGRRRVIISTNIAESSITLPDVRYIIDFGLTKELVFNSSTKCERLQMQWACKAVMQQRAGRAGRVAEGVCFRLMPEAFYAQLKDHSVPEIQRCPLDKLILKVKQLNLGTPVDILSRAIQPPDINEVMQTEQYLKEMGALNDENSLTWLGRVYADMPCNVKISRLCLFGYIFGCLHDSLIMGAIMSQEKPIFVSGAQLEFRHAQFEAKRYAKKLMWDCLRESDPIAMLAAYKKWYESFGRSYVKLLKKNTFAATRQPEIPQNERNWCKNNALDYKVLREVTVTYRELKRRLSFMGLAKQHLSNRLNLTPDSVLTLKLCIAAAYNEKYLTSFYAFEDEIMRRKKEQLLKERQSAKIIIPGIPKEVNTEDIREILKESLAKNLEIEIDRENAIVTFDMTESIRPLQMSLWMGTFPQRYRCGNFVIAKKFIQDKHGNIIERVAIDNPQQIFQRVAGSQPREGMKIDIDHSKLADKFVHIEAYCIQRPEYVYRLNFQDFVTGSIISMDDSSVCRTVLEVNTAFEKCHMAVCCELIEKRNRTVASNITLMPTIPLLPHILSLLFTRDVSLFEANQRYGGIKIVASVMKFTHTFTGKDIEEINEIRKEISLALFDEQGILNPKPLNVREKIIKLINKRRLPLVDEKFRKLITHVEENVMEDDVMQVEEPEVNSEIYLKPIRKIASVKDDLRNWTDEGQRKIELEMMQIRVKKEVLVQEIKNRARISKMVRPELICRICKNTICAYFNAIEVESSPVHGKFKLNCIFGSIRYEDQLPENVSEEFLRSLDDDATLCEAWAMCMEGHLVGWKIKDICYINHKSPLNVLRTDGSEIEWSCRLWRSGYHEFINDCKKYEVASGSKNKAPIRLYCDICQTSFESSTEFFNHVIVGKEHTDNVTRFLKEGY